MRSLMKYLACTVIITGIAAMLYGQEWKYTQHFAVTVKSEVRGLTIDSDSNLYVTLFHREDVTHSGPFGTAVYPTNGRQDIQLIKLAADGDTLWHRSAGSAHSDYPRRVALDDNEDPYLTGIYRRNELEIQGINLPVYDEYEIFLAKYLKDGSDVFARRVAWGPGNDVVEQIAIDKLGNIYMIGYYDDSLFFEQDTLVTELSAYNLFLAKFKANGDFRWAKNIPSSDATGNTKLIELTIANNTEIYLGGFFFGDLTIGTTTLSSQGTTEEDMLLVKIDSSGTPLWIRQGGSNTADRLNSIASDKYGNVYVTGYFTGTASFDSTGTGIFNSSPMTSAGGYDMFMAKYNKNGTLLWKRRNGDTGNDIAYGAVVHENIVQFTGYFSGDVTFNTAMISSGSTDNEDTGFFIYDTDGNPITAHSIQGNGEDRGEQIEYDLNGNTYIGGYFSSDTLHIGSDELIKAPSSTSDGFVAKYKNPFTATFTKIQNVACNGDANGRLVITPYFGVGPYSFAWSHDAGLTDSIATNLAAGTYGVTITDSRAFIAENSIELIDPDPLSIGFSVTDVSCHPDNGTSNNGTIDITVTGGTVEGTYDYTWEAITGSGVNATSEDQVSLTAGQYSVTVTDDHLCMEDDTFDIVQPLPIQFTGSIVTPATGGGSDGAIDLNPSGGNDSSPYTFVWSNLETTEDISNLSAGNYTVTVTDVLSCQADSTFLVNDVDAFLAFIINKVDVNCHGNTTGSATVGTSGGTGPYDYAWRTSGGLPVGTNAATLSNVGAGTYIVEVTDNSDGRTAEASVDINEPAQALSTFIDHEDLECYGDNSGVADLTVSGGTLPYVFAWSNGANTEDLVNVAASSYAVTVTDNKGCQETDEVEISQPPSMDINITIDQTILCHGDLTGVLTATATGGIGTKTYIWDDPGTQTEQTATNLGAGFYNVTATDQNGCTVSDNIQLTQPAELLLSETHLDITCFGEADGSIDLIPAGGTIPYAYSWSNGYVQQDPFDLAAGTYSVVVSDVNNCEADLEVEITEPDAVVIQDISTTDVSCQGYTDGSITITAVGGIGNYAYSIDNGANFGTDSIFTDLVAGIYAVQVQDGNGCLATPQDANVTEPEGTVINSEEVSNVSCFGAGDGSLIITATNTAGALVYSIDEGVSYLDNSGIFEELSGGTYQILIMDINGCVIQSTELTVEEPEEISVDTTVTPASGGQGGIISLSATGGTSPYTYFLFSGIADTSSGIGIFEDLVTGEYVALVEDAHSCTSDSVYVQLRGEGSGLMIYNAFSPNEDGINDTWTIGNIGSYPECTVVILNTWGTKVFESEGYTQPWDGTYKDRDLPAGTYYYIIDLGDGTDALTGPVSIVR